MVPAVIKGMLICLKHVALCPVPIRKGPRERLENVIQGYSMFQPRENLGLCIRHSLFLQHTCHVARLEILKY
jgi:hypothetical protein